MALIRETRFMAALIRAKITGQVHPLMAAVCVTGRCNAHCEHCYGRYFENRNLQDLPTARWMDLLGELIAGGTRWISLSGGEPLMRNDIGALVDFVRRKGCFCNLDTNGILLPERIAEVRAADVIRVSVDGDERAHDALRGAGTFRRALRGVDAARNAGVRVELSAVLTRDSIPCLDEVARLARDRGAWVRFDCLTVSDARRRDHALDPLAPDEEQLRGALARILQLKRDGWPIVFSARALYYVRQWQTPGSLFHLGGTPDFPHPVCTAGRLRCFISHEGNVYPCCARVGSFEPRNCFEVGLPEALRHAREANACRACRVLSQVDANLVLNLDPPVLFSTLRDIVCRHARARPAPGKRDPAP